MWVPVCMQNQLDFLLGQPCAARQSADPWSCYDWFFFYLHLFLPGFNPHVFLCFTGYFHLPKETIHSKSPALLVSLLASWHSLVFKFFCFWIEKSPLSTCIIFLILFRFFQKNMKYIRYLILNTLFLHLPVLSYVLRLKGLYKND